MRRLSLPLFVIVCVGTAFGQTVYTGFVDKYPVEFVVDQIYSSNGDSQSVQGLYMYTHFNEPIPLTGTINKTNLTLNELSNTKQTTATFLFNPYFQEKDSIVGIWKNRFTNKELTVRLLRNYNFDVYDSVNNKMRNRELLQVASLKNYFFRVLISKSTTNPSPTLNVNGVKIFDKKTGEKFQSIDLDCEYLERFNSVAVDDYNFDGIPDFSVFERSYTGPNTTSKYFLYDPKPNRFFDSGFEGTSLEFDGKKKLVYEHNECCGGSEITNSTYKVVNNKMVPVKQKTIKNNEDE